MTESTKSSSESEQSGTATRGTEAGSAAEVTAAGAGAGVAQSGAGAQYGVAGAEGISDVGQAEAQIKELIRGSQGGSTFDSHMRGHLSRLSLLGEMIVARALDNGHRITANATTHDKNLDGAAHSERENSVQISDKTNSIDIASLVTLLQNGVVMSCPNNK